MIKTLQKHGNSMALVIEKPMMEALGIKEDTPSDHIQRQCARYHAGRCRSRPRAG